MPSVTPPIVTRDQSGKPSFASSQYGSRYYTLFYRTFGKTSGLAFVTSNSFFGEFKITFARLYKYAPYAMTMTATTDNPMIQFLIILLSESASFVRLTRSFS